MLVVYCIGLHDCSILYIGLHDCSILYSHIVLASIMIIQILSEAKWKQGNSGLHVVEHTLEN